MLLKKLSFNGYIELVPQTTVKMSDCPICYEQITKESGVTTLGCSHSYHIKCYAKWGLENNSCPCCRHQGGTNENLTDLIPEDENQTAEYDDGISDIDDTIEEAIQQLRPESVNMAIQRWIRAASGRWVVDNPVPELQLPPHIERLHFERQLNANAEPFVPTELHNAATRITAVAKGFLVRRRQSHEQINVAAQSLMGLSH